MTHYKCVIFDWDGTLNNSSSTIVSNMQDATEILNLTPPSDEAILKLVGLNLSTIFPILYPERDAKAYQKMVDTFVEISLANQHKETLFDGALDVLKMLHQEGLKLAVATGKSRRGLNTVFKRNPHFHDLFITTRTGDETASKPSPLMLEEILDELQLDVSEAVMIGDTTFDLKMARTIEMDSIGVSYGVHTPAQLKTESPLTIIDSISELIPAIFRS